MKTPCIISPLRKDEDGYPRIKWRGKSMPAARLVMIVLYGEAAVIGKMVLHRCDNPGCVNPAHLYLGDFNRNMQDKAERGRVAGEKNSRCKLTDAQCKRIRAMYATGNYYQWELGEMFEVQQTTISEIVTGKRRGVR